MTARSASRGAPRDEASGEMIEILRAEARRAWQCEGRPSDGRDER